MPSHPSMKGWIKILPNFFVIYLNTFYSFFPIILYKCILKLYSKEDAARGGKIMSALLKVSWPIPRKQGWEGERQVSKLSSKIVDM
jgi:hypothetical protein